MTRSGRSDAEGPRLPQEVGEKHEREGEREKKKKKGQGKGEKAGDGGLDKRVVKASDQHQRKPSQAGSEESQAMATARLLREVTDRLPARASHRANVRTPARCFAFRS